MLINWIAHKAPCVNSFINGWLRDPRNSQDSPTSIRFFFRLGEDMRLCTIFFSGGHVVLHMRIHNDNMAGISEGINLRKYSGLNERII